MSFFRNLFSFSGCGKLNIDKDDVEGPRIENNDNEETLYNNVNEHVDILFENARETDYVPFGLSTLGREY